MVPAGRAARVRQRRPRPEPTVADRRQVALDCVSRSPTGAGVVWARGAGGPSRSGKCGAAPSVPRASPASRPDGAIALRAQSATVYPARMHLALARRRPHGRGARGRPARRRLGARRRSRSPRSTPTAARRSRSGSPGCGCPEPGVGGGRRRGRRGRGEAGRRASRRSRLSPRSCPRTRSSCRSRPGSRSPRRGRGARPTGGAGDAQHRRARRPGRGRDRRRHATPPSSTSRSASGSSARSASSCGCPKPSSTRSPGSRAPGPAYVFLVAEAMIEAGVLVGLPARHQRRSSARPCSARRRCSPTASATPESLRAAVTSPGGTTAAGLQVLEAHGVRAAFLDAVDAATQALERARARAREHASPRSSRLPPKLPDPASDQPRATPPRARACASG